MTKTDFLKAKEKLERTELKTRKFEVRQEEKKQKKSDKFDKRLEKVLKTKLVSRSIVKPSQLTIVIKKQEQQPVKQLHFKDIMEQEKRSLFFS